MGLIVTLLMALCLLFGADSGPKDSLLYAKFQARDDYIYICVYIYMYTYMCVCICVYWCADIIFVYVCMYVYWCVSPYHLPWVTYLHALNAHDHPIDQTQADTSGGKND